MMLHPQAAFVKKLLRKSNKKWPQNPYFGDLDSHSSTMSKTFTS